MNRRLTGRLANVHFSPTETSKANLLRENVDEAAIFVTGNTVIDALIQVKSQLENSQELKASVAATIKNQGYDLDRLKAGRRLVLVTGHRRENFGDGEIAGCSPTAEKYYP